MKWLVCVEFLWVGGAVEIGWLWWVGFYAEMMDSAIKNMRDGGRG